MHGLEFDRLLEEALRSRLKNLHSVKSVVATERQEQDFVTSTFLFAVQFTFSSPRIRNTLAIARASFGKRVGDKIASREGSVSQNAFFSTLLLSCLAVCSSAIAQENSQEEMRSLDELVQEVKTDVLTIARDLALLEERLLYPSNTQVAVFVETDGEEDFRLDALQIQIDGNSVAHHIYSFKELDALQNGGVQRVYTGNVVTGSHQMTVTINGKLANGTDFTSSETFSFSKGIDPRLIGLTLAGASGGASIALSDW